jgi:hypothetical protein
MGFTSENLITNTAAVTLLWIWVHLFYNIYVQKGPLNYFRLLQFNIIDGFLWHLFEGLKYRDRSVMSWTIRNTVVQKKFYFRFL